jgi:hypothetical protein
LPWHFLDEIRAREKSFLDNGGMLVTALPKYQEITK